MRRGVAKAPVRGRISPSGSGDPVLSFRRSRCRTAIRCRLPPGFETVADAGLAGALRNRSFVARRGLAFEKMLGPELVGASLRSATAEPLLRFGWAALDGPATLTAP